MSEHSPAHSHAGHGHHDAGHHGHGHGHDAHRVNYFYVFLALCVFTALSVVADVIGIFPHRVTIVLVLGIATAKAVCVMLFFMHLLFERAWKYVLLAPTIILAIGIPLALLPDIGLHYYTEDVPQMRIPNPEPGGHGGGHGEHGATEAEKEANAEPPPQEERATKE